MHSVTYLAYSRSNSHNQNSNMYWKNVLAQYISSALLTFVQNNLVPFLHCKTNNAV
jgi:hypothetical protein